MQRKRKKRREEHENKKAAKVLSEWQRFRDSIWEKVLEIKEARKQTRKLK